MHKINIIAVGNLKEKYWTEAIEEYKKRLSRFAKVEIKEVAEALPNSRTSVDQIKKLECDELVKHLVGVGVAMDKSGKQLTSEEFAKFIETQFANGAKAITFVIGGSNGLTADFVESTNATLSFGKLTYPHQLMRVVLLEQIYRAETILNNISYHK